jgi:signal transduction histidine kinase
VILRSVEIDLDLNQISHISDSITDILFLYMQGRGVIFIVTRNIENRRADMDRNLMVQREWTRVETSRTHTMTLAHDLRTPLAILDLRLRSALALPHTSTADIILGLQTAVDHMNFIVDRTIDSCRALHGDKPTPLQSVVNLSDLIHDTLAFVECYPKAVDIDVRLGVTALASEFVSDTGWLLCILINLLTNACDATMFGQIVLTVTNDEHTIVFKVIDTGVGVEMPDRAHLFQPFTK